MRHAFDLRRQGRCLSRFRGHLGRRTAARSARAWDAAHRRPRVLLLRVVAQNAIATGAHLLWCTGTDPAGPKPEHLQDLPDGTWLAHLRRRTPASERNAARGVGDTLVSRAVIDRAAANGALPVHTISMDPPLYDTFAVVRRRDVGLSPATEELTRLAVDLLLRNRTLERVRSTEPSPGL